jgi:hypothetical protein
LSAARVVPPRQPDELGALLGFLDFLRQTVAWKVQGITEEQARFSPVPSGTSALGLVRHLTGVEGYWFPHVFLGQARPQIYRTADDRSLAFTPGPDDTLADALSDYAGTCAASNEIVAAASLDDVAAIPHPVNGAANLRWIVTHMIEETARHAGHLDIIRELIDGTTGE